MDNNNNCLIWSLYKLNGAGNCIVVIGMKRKGKNALLKALIYLEVRSSNMYRGCND